MSRIIILNGPPGSGKDTIANLFSQGEGYEHTSFKLPMFKIAAATLGFGVDDFISLYQDRDWKEEPKESLNGASVRDLMIQISESFIKPFLGNTYFGQQACSYVEGRSWYQGFIFSDGGFKEEVEYLSDAGHDVILVHLYREGCTFEGDSRSYVLSNKVKQISVLNNNGTVEEAVDELGRILDQYIDNNQPRSEQQESPPIGRRVSRQRIQPSRDGSVGHSIRRGHIHSYYSTYGDVGSSTSISDTLRAVAEAQSFRAINSGAEVSSSWVDEPTFVSEDWPELYSIPSPN